MFNVEETLSTLRFGKRAKEIKNRIAVNEELSIDQYKARLAAAKLKIQHLERENNTLKKKMREMMVIASKSSDKELVLKLEAVVKNVDLNPIPTTSKSHHNKHKKSKLGHSRNKSTLTSLTLGSIKNTKSRKQNKMSRSMSVQMNDETLMDINRICEREDQVSITPNRSYDDNDDPYPTQSTSPILTDHSFVPEPTAVGAYQVSDVERREILRLQEKVAELKGELDASESQQSKLADEKSELYQGHLQLREQFEDQQMN